MGFKLFSMKCRESPIVTISKNGIFMFNKASRSHWHLQKGDRIHIFWDKDFGKIGFKATNEELHSYSISPNGFVSATAFLKAIGYSLKESKSFPITWNDKEQLLECQIKS
jgi:hypothetical protein